MENQNADTCRISIYAHDANGILSRILQLFSKSRFAINYIQVFKTEDENLQLIMVDASFPNEMMPLMLNRIEKIIEVERAIPHTFERKKQLLALYTVPTHFCETALYIILKNRGVQVSATTENALVLQLVGEEEEIEEVRRLLSETVNTGFHKSMWPDLTGLPLFSQELHDRTRSQPFTNCRKAKQ